MADLIALEWNRDHVRLITATVKSRGFTIEHAETIPLSNQSVSSVGDSSTGDESKGSEQIASDRSLADRIGAAAQKAGAGKAAALVSIPRSSAELRLMNVPPAPDDELPEIVRFQALQQFTAISESCPLDFAPTGESPGGAKQVVAAAIPAALMKEITSTVIGAGLTLQGVVLRPTGTVALLRNQVHLDADEVCLVVDRLGGEQTDEVELTVVNDAAILIARTVRLPKSADHGPVAESLAAEVRRTLIAARTQLGGRKISGIVVCGSLDEAERTALEKTDLPVSAVNPFAKLSFSNAAEREFKQPDAAGYAPLLGMIQQEASETSHEIDFLRPRRPAPPPDRRKFWTTVATLVLTAMLLLGAFLFWKLDTIDQKITQLRRESTSRNKTVEVAERQTRFLDDVDEWQKSSPNWLAELKRLAVELPDGDKLQLESFNADLAVSGGGNISIKGKSDRSSTISELETSLRDERHKVPGVQRERADDDPKYPWQFEERIQIEPAVGVSLREQFDLEPMNPADTSDEQVDQNASQTNDSESDSEHTIATATEDSL